MIRLLSCEFYKLRKMRSFWVCLLISGVLSAIQLLSMYFLIKLFQSTGLDGADITVAGSSASMLNAGFSFVDQLSSALSISNAAILASIVVSLFCGSEFGKNTVHLLVTQKYSRTQVYGAKLIVSAIACVLIWLVYVVIYAVLPLILTGFGTAGDGFWGDIAARFGLQLLLMLGYAALFVCVAFLLRNSGAAIAVSLCLLNFTMLLVSLLSLLVERIGGGTYEDLSTYLPSGRSTALITAALDEKLVWTSLAAGVGLFLLASVLGVFTFSKRDIK